MQFIEKTEISEGAINLLVALETAQPGERVMTLKSAWRECADQMLITGEGVVTRRGREVLKQYEQQEKG